MGALRAAVLGANDGITSTASLILGVATASGDHAAILMAGVASLVAGAMAMAAGEYVSVHIQADTEQAALARERTELSSDRSGELAELASIYVKRGLDIDLAWQVAAQLTRSDGLSAHSRDELGMSPQSLPRPVQAALVSAGSFAAGAALPLLLSAFSPISGLVFSVPAASLFFMGGLGALAAAAGRAPILPSVVRVTFWGALAMGLTAGVGALFGAVA